MDLVSDQRYMREALKEAQKAYAQDEVPIGAVVVAPDGRIIGRGHNQTEALQDVTAHAEMLAVTAAANALGGKYLNDCTLYVTVEPCIMCAGALGWSQISRVVYGCSDPKRGYHTFVSNPQQPFHPKCLVQGGLLQDEAAALMQKFFKEKR